MTSSKKRRDFGQKSRRLRDAEYRATAAEDKLEAARAKLTKLVVATVKLERQLKTTMMAAIKWGADAAEQRERLDHVRKMAAIKRGGRHD